MELQRLQYLIQRRLDGALTDLETRELERLAAEEPDAVVAVMTGMMGNLEPEMEDAVILDARFAAVMRADRTEDPVEVAGHAEAVDGRSRTRRLWPYFSAAAAVIVLVVAVYLIRAPRVPSVPVLPVAERPVIVPGGNKAVLTLANGQRIVLDSAGTGSLAKQGGVQVMKLDSGLLSYKAGGEITGDDATAFNVLSTPRGGQYQLVLPDGTHVWLNSASSLRYPVAFANTREVELTGEAYFEVTKRTGAPFMVRTPHSRVEVLGTAFNLMAYPDEYQTRTTLINGVVKVTQRGASRLIQPGEQAAVDNQSGDIAIERPDLEEVVAWKNGRFQFGNTDLRTIMRQVERWYDVEVEYRKNVDSIYFAGRISRKQYASQLLEILETDGRVHFSIEGKKIIVQ